jgi:trimeric autotransporter adhesin
MKRTIQLVILLPAVLFLTAGKAQTWSRVGKCGTGHSQGGAGLVNSIIVFQDSLYIAGSFDSVANMSIKNIAGWNGMNYFNVKGETFSGRPSTLSEYNSQLCAGGGGSSFKHIASYNGTGWNTIGGGSNSGGVFTSAVYNGELYIAGNLTDAGGVFVNRIARWDGSSWKAVGSGVTGGVTDIATMAVYKGELYAGGSFNMAGGKPAWGVARWNGTSWDSIEGGVDDYVRCMVVDTVKNVLYIGGNFNYVDDTIYSPYVAMWDGTKWHGMKGGEFMWGAYGLGMYRGELYCGTATGSVDSIFVKWNDSTQKWLPIPGLAGGTVTTMQVYHDTLFVGGSFTSINGDSGMRGIAKYYAPPKPISVGEVKKKEMKLSVNPNPLGDKAIIQYELPAEVKKAVFTLYDLQGKLIKSVSLDPKTTSALLNCSDLRNGIYLYDLELDGVSVQRRKIVILK